MKSSFGRGEEYLKILLEMLSESESPKSEGSHSSAAINILGFLEEILKVTSERWS